MQPLISVIVPIYKVEKYLHQCVDSILNQTYKNLEVILVDDGSPDGCPAICDEYVQQDERVKVIHKKNGGLSDARNAGMAVAKGEYLSFVDSDDLLPPNAMETLLNIALYQQADMVIGGHNRFEDTPTVSDDSQKTVTCWTSVEAMADMLRNGCASWARLYRRELHQLIPFPVGEINEDEAIVLQLLEKCNCVAMTNTIVYHYRCRPESITTAKFSSKRMDWPKHCKANLNFIQEKYPQLELDAAVRYRSSLLWALREIALSEQTFSAAQKELRKQLRDNRALFSKAPFKEKRDWARYLMMTYLPFGVNRAVLRLRHKV